ncbi:MAG: hydroxyacid dehydrogenase [Candidatus Korobacteraceae bacterium]
MKEKIRVLVTGAELVSAAVEKLSSAGATLTMMPGKITEQRLIDELAQQPTQAILMRGNPPVTRTVLEAAPALRVVAKHGVGVDSVDVAAATEKRILVMVAGEANAPAVAEMTLAFMLALGRDLESLSSRTKAGQWQRGSYHGNELRGRTLGLVGCGRIGRRVAQLARCLGMRVIAFTRSPASVDPALAEAVASLESLLAESDIVSLHCPLTGETRAMMTREAFSSMKPGALFINTARGALVDETALAEALQSGHLSGTALDTLAEEPPAPGNPLLFAPNIMITPHVAGQTSAAVERMGIAAAENIVAVLTGKRLDPANVVNRELLGAIP